MVGFYVQEVSGLFGRGIERSQARGGGQKGPMRPRAHVWFSSEPSTSEEMEEILLYCNPKLPTYYWKEIKVEKTEGPYRQALILLNAEASPMPSRR